MEEGVTTEFNEQGCQIYNESNKLIAVAKKTGSLYYLNCLKKLMLLIER